MALAASTARTIERMICENNMDTVSDSRSRVVFVSAAGRQTAMVDRCSPGGDRHNNDYPLGRSCSSQGDASTVGLWRQAPPQGRGIFALQSTRCQDIQLVHVGY